MSSSAGESSSRHVASIVHKHAFLKSLKLIDNLLGRVENVGGARDPNIIMRVAAEPQHSPLASIWPAFWSPREADHSVKCQLSDLGLR